MYEKYRKCKEAYLIEKFRFETYLKEYELLKKIVSKFLIYLQDNMERILYYVDNCKNDRQAYQFSLQYTKLEKYYKVFLKYRRKLMFYRSLDYFSKMLKKIEEIRSEYYIYNRISRMDYMYEKRDEVIQFLYHLQPLLISIQSTIDMNNERDVILENDF